jgi:Cytochrome c7 and related cytochrome c
MVCQLKQHIGDCTPERSGTVDNHSGLTEQVNQGNGFISRIFKKPVFQIGLGIVLLFLLSGAGYGLYQTQLSPPQPIQFPHSKHISLGVQCLYCHPGALRGQSPGLPTEAKCYACHQQVAKTSPELDKLTAFVKLNEPIPWVPVFILPDFVYYSHRPHIAAGLNCENCHGEISQEALARPQKMNMGWCLSCHRTRFRDDPVMLTRLTDCVTCHR